LVRAQAALFVEVLSRSPASCGTCAFFPALVSCGSHKKLPTTTTMNMRTAIKALFPCAIVQQACGHGAVTRPLPRKVAGQTYCPWCVGEHQPAANPPGTINHDAVLSSPCMGSSRGDERYTKQHMGKYGVVADAGPGTYEVGQTFEASIALDADHNGDAQWQLCPHSQADEDTEECFRQYRLSEWVDVHSFWDPTNEMDHWKSGQTFPQNVTLSGVPAGPATLRWLWVCKYTDELFVSCIDIDIVSDGPTPSPLPTSVPVTPSPTPAPAPTPALGPCSATWGQCGGENWNGPTCCDAGSGCVVSNPYYAQCLPGAPGPAPSTPSPTTPAPVPSPTPSPGLGGSCSCTASTAWNGGFGQFASGVDFCGQNFGGPNPWVSAGGGIEASGGWSGNGPCESGQYSFSESDGWRIDVPKNLAQGKAPYRAFGYAQFCNGQPYSACWGGQEKVSFSFSFKTEGIIHVGAYVKLLFWTDAGNILGFLPPRHPMGDGQFRLLAFPANDYPNSWSKELQIQDLTWYHVQIDFTPSSRAVTIHIDGVHFADGTIPVDMLMTTNGPQIGVYSFDFNGPEWPEAGFGLWVNDACVGQASGACPSGGSGQPVTVSPTSAPTTMTPSPATTTVTTSTLTPKLGECKSFCALSMDSWAFKCSWDCCMGCGECVPTTTTTTESVSTTARTTATTVTHASTTLLPQVCKSWCADNGKPWLKKCTWDKCRGCAECLPLGRRLAVHTKQVIQAFFV